MANQSLLSFSTEIIRKCITVDGKDYLLRRNDELTIPQEARLRTAVAKFTGAPITTQEEAEEAQAWLAAAFLDLVIDGAEIERRLTDFQKAQVLSAFLSQAANPPAAETAAETKPAGKLGRKPKSSRAWPDSMAAARNG